MKTLLPQSGIMPTTPAAHLLEYKTSATNQPGEVAHFLDVTAFLSLDGPGATEGIRPLRNLSVHTFNRWDGELILEVRSPGQPWSTHKKWSSMNDRNVFAELDLETESQVRLRFTPTDRRTLLQKLLQFIRSK